MNTRTLMTSSAAFLAALGIAITFLPQELAAHVDAPPHGASVLLVQMLGGLYLGFAALNWMNRGNRIGGIYARPVSMANFINFAVGALALAKGVLHGEASLEVIAMAALYAIFAAWFGFVLFTHPAERGAT
jgi:hypothetical protein